jgi:DNA-binding MarR family transcriptional regulator
MSTARQDWSAAELALAADQLFAALRRGRTRLVSELAGDLSPVAVALLEPLLDAGELPVGRLAELAGVTVPTVTRQLQQLQRNEVILRRRDPADDRRVLVGLTQPGRARLETMRGVLREHQTSAYAALSATERAELGSAMTRLARLVERSVETAGPCSRS